MGCNLNVTENIEALMSGVQENMSLVTLELTDCNIED